MPGRIRQVTDLATPDSYDSMPRARFQACAAW
jgi:hypothetical protein